MQLETIFENTLIKLLNTREIQDCLVMTILDKHVVDLQKLIRETIETKSLEIVPLISTTSLMRNIAESVVDKNAEFIKQQMEKGIHTEEFKANIANVLVDSIKAQVFSMLFENEQV